MAIVKTLDVFCDGDCCLTWTEGGTSTTAAEVRRWARGRGWTRRDGKDLCPECSESQPCQPAPKEGP